MLHEVVTAAARPDFSHTLTAHTNVNIHVCISAANWWCSVTMSSSLSSLYVLAVPELHCYVKVPVELYPQMCVQRDKETFNGLGKIQQQKD